MIDYQNENHDDLLDRATEALLQAPTLQEPSEEFLSQVVAKVEATDAQPFPLSFLERIRAMNPLTTISATAATLLILSAAILWPLTTGGGASIALADVVEVLEKIRSATFSGTTTKEGEPPMTSKSMFLEPARYRMESSRDMIMIFNGAKMLTLAPSKKIAVLVNLDNPSENQMSSNWLEDVRKKLQAAQNGSSDDVQSLGKQTFDGKEAVGFRLHYENQEMTIWADPKTAMPIRVEQSAGVVDPKYHTVMSDFNFNVELDESLFSVEPPEGYSVQNSNMDASKSKEKDLVEMLRLYATNHEDGHFPPTLEMTEIMRVPMQGVENEVNEKFGNWRNDAKLQEKVFQSEEYNKLMAVGITIGRGMGFLQQELPPESEWQYAGKEVKLDTPNRPIFWYQPNAGKNYRVIYADLRTNEVAETKLKDFPDSNEHQQP